jgi:hypothetical protein
MPQHCGGISKCPIGNGNCNYLAYECRGDGDDGGNSAWLKLAEQSISTMIDSAMHDSALYSIKFYLTASQENSLVIRAYDAWQNVQINTTTIPLYFELIPTLISKYNLLTAKYNNSNEIIVDANVKELIQQVINHHRGYGDSNFQSHLDYLQSKVGQYQGQTVNQVNAALYPGSEDDPLIQ